MPSIGYANVLLQKIDRFFRISERGSTFSTEIRGGLITFLSMAYILVVGPNIMGPPAEVAGYTFSQVFTAIAVAAMIACLLMGLYSRFPVALAPGLGANTFLSYTICMTMGFTFEQGLLAVLISGILFFTLTMSGFRVKVLNCIPKSMKLAISAGIGFFIAVIGLYNAGIIESGEFTALQLGRIADPGVLLALFCIIITLIMWHKKLWFATIGGLLLTWIVGVAIGVFGVESDTGLIPKWNVDDFIVKPDFGLFGAVFRGFEMFDESLIMSFIAAAISLFVVDLFDTTGTLIAVGSEAGLVDEDGNLIGGEKALTADAATNVVCSVIGTTSSTTFIESMTGIAAGAKTGLMAVTVGVMFAISLLFSGLFSTFTSACIAGALVLVGMMMIKNVKDIEWSDPVTCSMAFMTIFMMGLTGSITNGIAAGVFVWIVGMAVTGRAKEVSVLLWILSAVFGLYLVINYILIPNGWL